MFESKSASQDLQKSASQRSSLQNSREGSNDVKSTDSAEKGPGIKIKELLGISEIMQASDSDDDSAEESDLSTKRSLYTDISGSLRSEIASGSEIGNSHSWSSGETNFTTTSRSVVDENFFSGVIGGITEMLIGPTRQQPKHSNSYYEDETDASGTDDESKILGNVSNYSSHKRPVNKTKKNIAVGARELLKDDTRSVFSTIISETFDSSSDMSDPGNLTPATSTELIKEKFDKSLAIAPIAQRINYNSDKAKLYRAIDTKNWDSASFYLRNNPEMARLWVFRLLTDPRRDVQWVFLPIHAVCFSNAPLHVVRDLVEAYPESLNIPADGEKLPLHIACETGASHEVVNYLVKMNPASLYHLDSNNNTPLQKCVFSMNGKSNRAKVMKILIKAASGKEDKRPKMKGFFGKRNKKQSKSESVA